MNISELKQLIEDVVTNEVRKNIMEQSEEGNKNVYHIKCEGIPLATFDSEEEANEALPTYQAKHKDGELIIEKGVYESHDDMMEKFDEMNDELDEENTNQDMEKEPKEGNEFSGALKAAKDAGEKTFTVDGKEYDVEECWSKEMSEGYYFNMDKHPDFVNHYYDEESGTHKRKADAPPMKDYTFDGEKYVEKEPKGAQFIGRFGDDDNNTGWIGDKDGSNFDDNHDDYEDHEEFHDYPSFKEKFAGKTDWFNGDNDDNGSERMFNAYKDQYKTPLRIKRRRGMEEEEGTCMECGSGGMYESKKKTVRLTESELIKLIGKMVSESVPGLQAAEKAHRESGSENVKALSDSSKKINDYLKFDGNDNPKFPKPIGKGDKVARENTKEQDEETDRNFAGLQNLEYDIEPSQQFKDRLKKAIEGHSSMGNAPIAEKPSIEPSNGADKGKEAEDKEGNVIATPETAKKLNTQVKNRAEDKKKRVLYNKESVPVNESVDPSKVILNEEINKMKKMANYNKKTQ